MTTAPATDTSDVCASIIRAYADLREQYLHGHTDFHGETTTDSDRWLLCEIQGLRSAAELICAPTGPQAPTDLTSRHWEAWDGIVEDIRAEAAAARERKARIIAGVQEAVDATFEDGTSMIEYLFLTNPQLKARLSAALGAGRRREPSPSQPPQTPRQRRPGTGKATVGVSHRDQLAALAADRGWTVAAPFTDILVIDKAHASLIVNFDLCDFRVLTAVKRVYEYPDRADLAEPVYRRQFVHVGDDDGDGGTFNLAAVAGELRNH